MSRARHAASPAHTPAASRSPAAGRPSRLQTVAQGLARRALAGRAASPAACDGGHDFAASAPAFSLGALNSTPSRRARLAANVASPGSEAAPRGRPRPSVSMHAGNAVLDTAPPNDDEDGGFGGYGYGPRPTARAAAAAYEAELGALQTAFETDTAPAPSPSASVAGVGSYAQTTSVQRSRADAVRASAAHGPAYAPVPARSATPARRNAAETAAATVKPDIAARKAARKTKADDAAAAYEAYQRDQFAVSGAGAELSDGGPADSDDYDDAADDDYNSSRAGGLSPGSVRGGVAPPGPSAGRDRATRAADLSETLALFQERAHMDDADAAYAEALAAARSLRTPKAGAQGFPRGSPARSATRADAAPVYYKHNDDEDDDDEYDGNDAAGHAARPGSIAPGSSGSGDAYASSGDGHRAGAASPPVSRVAGHPFTPRGASAAPVFAAHASVNVTTQSAGDDDGNDNGEDDEEELVPPPFAADDSAVEHSLEGGVIGGGIGGDDGFGYGYGDDDAAAHGANLMFPDAPETGDAGHREHRRSSAGAGEDEGDELNLDLNFSDEL